MHKPFIFTMIAVMKAFEAGKKIECTNRRESSRGVWHEIVTPSWAWDSTNYRVKVEPREIWVWQFGRGEEERELVQAVRTKEPSTMVLDEAHAGGKWVKFREVIE